MGRVRSASSAARFARRNVDRWKKEKARKEKRKAFLEKAKPNPERQDWADRRKMEIEFRTAVLHGDLEKVKTMMLNGAYDSAEQSDWNALCAACSNGHHEIARFLLEVGMDPDARDSFGKTALMNAATYGYDGIARLLFEHGADIKARDRDGMTAKELAMKHCKQEMGVLLHELERGR